MFPSSTAGWLPIAIGFDASPAVLPDAPVRWMEFGAERLRGPFFEHDILRRRTASPRAREAETDLLALIRAGSRLPPVDPAGFIFHVSRCGSIVIANALRTAERTVVLSEPQPVASLLLRTAYPVGPYLRARWDALRRTALPALFALSARYRTGEPEQVVVKFPSVNILDLAAIRRYWPRVPCLVVIRDPVEVMVANRTGRGWMSWKDTPTRARELFRWADTPEAIEAMSREEFGARVLAAFLEAAMAGVDSGCMVLDYENLSEARVRDVAAHFGMELPGSDRLRPVLNAYAKDPAGRRHHLDDRAAKRRLAGRELLDAAQKWAMPAYYDLRAR
jgi:hypothetical protein